RRGSRRGRRARRGGRGRATSQGACPASPGPRKPDGLRAPVAPRSPCYGRAVNDPVAVLDLFVRGLAAGAMAAWSLAVARSGVSRQARLTTLALGVSVICWLTTESPTLRNALGDLNMLVALAFPLGGLFWLFVLTVFEDRPLTWPA